MPAQQHNNFSAADIERYHKGGMTATEMHALEKAALEDPFLADALDGYAHTQTPVADVIELKQKVQRRSRNVVSLHRNRRLVFSIAALLILLIGFGWLAYQFSSDRPRVTALRKSSMPESNASSSTITDSTTSKPDESSTALNKPHDQVKDETVTQHDTEKKGSKSDGSFVQKKEAPTSDNDEANQQTFSKAHNAAPTAKTFATPTGETIIEKKIQGRIVDPQNSAVPNAIIVGAQDKILATTDATGNFSLFTNDTNLTVMVDALGYQNQKATLMPGDSAAKIVLQPATNSLNEVVVSANRKSTNQNNRVHLEAVKPTTGWNNFNRYVDANLDSLETANDNHFGNGEVVLSFDVDQSGKAVNIVIEKSISAAYDTMAVRLIQQGSRWKKTKAGKAHARIQF